MIFDLKKASPGMQQYWNVKQKYNDCIVLNRMGDFYEMFFEDAVIASKELDLILTSKKCGQDQRAPMCGVPYHAAQTYIAKLVAAGHKVAICEQLTQPTPGKNIMLERDVVRVITPGTIVEEEMLEGQKNNYLLSICKQDEKVGISYVDVSTGEFYVATFKNNAENEISNLIARILPSEVIGNEASASFYNSLPVVKFGNLNKLTAYYEWAYSKSTAEELLKEQFGENYNNVFDIKDNLIICSAGGLLQYLKETQKRLLANINQIKLVKNSNFLTIDLNTRRNLEIVESNRDRKKYGSLLWVIDKTECSMGARALRRMLDEPLQSAKEINERLDGVEELVKRIITRDKLKVILSDVYDIERLSSKIALGNITPKDIYTLGKSLAQIPFIKKELEPVESKILVEIRNNLVDVNNVASLIEKAINPELEKTAMKNGGYIKRGFNKELDDYRDAKQEGSNWVEELERKEIEATGIKNLKIHSNKIFGYFIEISKNQIDKVPLRYIRKQTLANNERYITEDLKVLEEKILGAEDKAQILENQILEEIKKVLLNYITSFQQIASAVAKLDALLSFAVVAVKNDYVRPAISNQIKEIKIVDGRHPVVEQFMQKGQFVENDTLLDEKDNRIMIITGPNMAGKSTYMRQVALITLLAHIGSFVPAKSASIPIVDRIFTRVGASDDLAFGQSTFMVEMSEVANILANATDKSLVVLDEIGRGTSTFDGLSIAWAVVEHISQNLKTKTLFATHYHELTDLEGVLDGVKNYKVAVKEIDEKVVFLRKIVRGGANKSFGVEVARLAGLPSSVLERANEISLNLEKVNNKLDLNIFKEKKEQAQDNTKLALGILSVIKDIDINRISPMHAFDILSDLVAKVKEGKE